MWNPFRVRGRQEYRARLSKAKGELTAIKKEVVRLREGVRKADILIAEGAMNVAMMRKELVELRRSTEATAVKLEQDVKAATTKADDQVRALLSDEALKERLQHLADILDKDSRPNLNALWRIARDLPAAHLTLKFFGYDLAERLRAALPVRSNLAPIKVGLKSKATTQADMESDWAAYWASQYKFPLLYHRKLWELFYCSQALYERDCLTSGKRGLGFGCGTEPLPSYFASRGVRVLATDAPPDHHAAQAWAQTSQHGSSLDQIFKPELVDRTVFDANVDHRFVDMNAIPDDLRNFDFCWSICSLEHLGTISRGLDFVENSLATLKPGGVAVHTTEFSFFDDKNTLDNWGTVFYQKKHFLEIAERLRAKGHTVESFDFDIGNKPLDRFIDIPPFQETWSEIAQQSWSGGHPGHLKVEWDGFVVTCFGLIVTKGQV